MILHLKMENNNFEGEMPCDMSMGWFARSWSETNYAICFSFFCGRLL
jgi:hypothetical protein